MYALAIALLLCLPLVGCDDADPLSPEEAALDDLRRAGEAFLDVARAHDAGYQVLVVHPTSGDRCLADPALGGMGFHYLNADLVDDEVSVTSPEVVIYEPDADGDLELVAVEYVVPFSIRGEDQEPPVLFGRSFKRNPTFQLWALHAWAWKENPSGPFADYNPDVSCRYAGAVE